MLPSNLFANFLQKTSVFNVSNRSIRAVWERGFLKDLYHRRVLLGADPILSRSAYPNWNYESELYAFSHRIDAPKTPFESLVRALTDDSYYSRADIQADSKGATPSKEHFEDITEDNSKLIEIGDNTMNTTISAFLRYAYRKAPEELILAVCEELLSEDIIVKIASNLGFNQLIRSANYPPSKEIICNAFKAMVASLHPSRAESLLLRTITPFLLDIDLIEAFPLSKPLDVLIDILKSNGTSVVEPRLLRSAGSVSAEPIYIVGIYGDEKLIAQSAGETLPIAVDMASRQSLLTIWGITSDLALPFGSRLNIEELNNFMKPNYWLKDNCAEKTDLSLISFDKNESLNLNEVYSRYKKDVEAVVGPPLRRRLRHKFSRGSIAKRSFRYIVKPRVYNI